MREGSFHMVESYDVGSLPFVGDAKKLLKGASRYGLRVDDSTVYFEAKVVEGFLDKARAGIDMPNYPQFRDMSEMFLEMIEGLERLRGGYVETGTPSIREERSHIPEVLAIKQRSQEIYERMSEPFELKVCVTGPYTLSSLFLYKGKETLSRLGGALSQVVENNVFDEKRGKVGLIAVDEPLFGLLDDPLMDRGSEVRERLLRAWESIFHKAKSLGVRTCLHLHSTADDLFWGAESLNVIESHVSDPLYRAKRTKELLESTDKFLKASICVTEFDSLIKASVAAASPQGLSESELNEKVAQVWKDITHGRANPTDFLEGAKVMRERLVDVRSRFGVERVPFAGPECGLKGFPSYECALECLRRVSDAIKDAEK